MLVEFSRIYIYSHYIKLALCDEPLVKQVWGHKKALPALQLSWILMRRVVGEGLLRQAGEYLLHFGQALFVDAARIARPQFA